MNFCFPKSLRLRKRHLFQRIAQQPTRYVGHWVIVESRQNKYPFTRLGITASRHYGKAVQRNRFKRITREAFRLCQQRLKPGFDINIKPRQPARSAKSNDILAELIRFMGHTDPLQS